MRRPELRLSQSTTIRSRCIWLSIPLALGLVVACNDTERGAAGAAGAAGGAGAAGEAGAAGAGGAIGPIGPGRVDRPEVRGLSIDEKLLNGTVASKRITLNIHAISTQSTALSRKIRVSMKSVDGATTHDSVDVQVALAPGASTDVSATLAMPDSISLQSDLVNFVIVIDEAASNGIYLTRSLQMVLPSYNLALEGPNTLVKGRAASYRVRATDPVSQKPLVGASTSIDLQKDGLSVATYTAITSSAGDAIFELSPPDSGTFQISSSLSFAGTKAQISSAVLVHAPGARVLLTSDKPIYQPGQVIHLRSVSLKEQGNLPMSAESVTFEVEDAKGNKVYKKKRTTDAYGIASTDFTLGSVVNMGDFKVRILQGEYSAEKTVKVGQYVLPKYKVSVQTDKGWYRAGEQALVVLDAKYFFGKPVSAGAIQVQAATLDVGENVFQTVQGQTDADGKFAFVITLPSSLAGLPLDGGNALINLKIDATDAAGQKVQQEQVLKVSSTGFDVALIPDNTLLVAGIENYFDLFASDPVGSPVASATVSLLLPDNTTQAGTTDADGHARFSWTPPSQMASTTFNASISAAGTQSTTSFSFETEATTEHVVVRSDKAVYHTGETAQIDLLSTETSPIFYVDWINEGQVVDMRTVQGENGKASFSMTFDATMTGSNRIEAYVVEPDGNIVRAGRTLFSRANSALAITTTTDKALYAPGEQAQITFSVQDDSGQPSVAALGVQIVDEAVYAIVDSKPGLLRTYFELEDSFATPQYEIHAPQGNIETLIYDTTASTDPALASAAQTRTGAAFAALGGKAPTGIDLSTWLQDRATSLNNLSTAYAAERTALTASLTARAGVIGGMLQAKGLSPQSYDYSDQVLAALAIGLNVSDFWGNKYRVSTSGQALSFLSMGPDELDGTGDEGGFSFYSTDLGIASYYGGYGTGGTAGASAGWSGGSGAAGASAGASGSAGVSGGGGAPSDGPAPRLRKDFPETLFVNPALITGADGKATITVPMADSITTWRVSSLAHSASGKLGGAVSGITVFQDFFTDISFPAALTRGDEITFPVAVYNYLDVPQSVSLQLESGSWYTALGATNMVVDLQPGEVKGVQIPVRVETVGVQSMKVTAIGSQKSDAVSRLVRVIPDGKEIASSQSSHMGQGSAELTVDYPVNSVAGSPHLHVDLFPAFLSQVVSGMDSMLQTPYGCFEQTTSTTWPNVLVTRYMTDTGQITPAIQLKAESLISAGYQRLMTYEHPGGGFSWFGTQDPAPYLSVTAFGLMEFADMAKVYEIDPAVISRTAQWLSAQKNSDGSWTGGMTESFSFNTSTLRNTAFVVWALASAGYTSDVSSSLSYLKNNAAGEQDNYTLGILANAFVLAAPSDPYTTALLDKLENAKVVQGDQISWSIAGTQTDFYGAGHDGDVTATAVITHAFLAAGGHVNATKGAIQYLAGSRDSNGNFGSTQATIWTLRALLLAASVGTEGAVGSVDISVDGAPPISVAFTSDQSDVMHTVDLSTLVTAGVATGSHEVTLSYVGTGNFSYNLVSRHNIPWADVAPDPSAPMVIAIAYDRTALAVNETVTATVTMTNTTTSTENMILATLGVPPGFEIVTEDLDAYLQSGVLSKYEVTGRQLILYVSAVAASSSQVFNYRLRATLPVTAADGGASIYPYYEPTSASAAVSTTFVVQAAL